MEGWGGCGGLNQTGCWLSFSNFNRIISARRPGAVRVETGMMTLRASIPGMRTAVLRTVNLLLFWGFCAVLGSGLALQFRLPRGRGHHGVELWGWDRHEWREIHFVLSMILLGLVGVHVLLHWKWLRTVAGRMRWWPLVVGLGVGVVLALVPLIWPLG